MFLKISQNSQENIYAEVSFAMKLHTGGLQLHYMQYVIEVLSCEFCEIFKNNFRKILGFYYTLKEFRHIFPWKFLNVYSEFRVPQSCISEFLVSEFLLIYPARKKHAQSSRQQRNVLGMIFGCLYNYLGKSFWCLWQSLIFINI